MNRPFPLMFSLVLLALCFATPTHAQSDPNKVFQANCSLCYGVHDAADTPTRKPLKATDPRSAAVQKATDAELASVIVKGCEKMPAFQQNTEGPAKPPVRA